MIPRCLPLASLAGLALSTPSDAQVRGMPVFFPATYAYSTRVGVDVAHGGEMDGLVVAGGMEHLSYVGNCARIGLSGAAGIWNPPGGAFDAQFTAGAGISYLGNSGPRPNSVPNPEIRVMAGGGLTRVGGRTVWTVPLGLGVGYLANIPIGRIQPWATLRVQYRESLTVPGESAWDLAFSVGVT
ncbi:MAG: hypothetical protein ACRDHY_11260, partial [Anaerolineales bacterium]